MLIWFRQHLIPTATATISTPKVTRTTPMMMTEAKIGEQLVKPLKFRAVTIRFEVVKLLVHAYKHTTSRGVLASFPGLPVFLFFNLCSVHYTGRVAKNGEGLETSIT